MVMEVERADPMVVMADTVMATTVMAGAAVDTIGMMVGVAMGGEDTGIGDMTATKRAKLFLLSKSQYGLLRL